MIAVLRRLDSDSTATFGIFSIGSLSIYSAERPWKDNLPNVSCIPLGVYQCIWTFSPRFRRYTYLVSGVPNRNGIRIHSANLPIPQLNGCIALGERLGWIDSRKAILLSASAIRRFEEYIAPRSFTLEIINA